MSLGAMRGWCSGFGGNLRHGKIAGDWSLLFRRDGCSFDNRGRRSLHRSDHFRSRGCNSQRRGNLDWRRSGGGYGGFGSCNRGRGGAWVSLADCGRCSRLLDHYGYGGRRCCDGRPRRNLSACGGFCHDGSSGRTAGDRGRRRRDNDGRRGARLRNDLTRFRASRSGRRRSGHYHGRSRFCWSRSWRDNRRHGLCGRMAVARRRLFFLLLGQDGLQNIARLGDMREIDLGRYALRGARLLT